MNLPNMSAPVARTAAATHYGITPSAVNGVSPSCDYFKCGLTIAKCVAKCTTSPTCYISCLGSLCKDCCDCIPGVGHIVCGLCP